MMKTFKKLILSSVALLMSITPVFAESYSGDQNNWTVDFDGSKMSSTFKNSTISDSVSQMQPGDDVTFKVSLTNKYSETTDWYMTNEVLQTLEEAQAVAKGGTYSYVLTYIDPNGESTLLYSNDSETLGGWDVENDGKEYVYKGDEGLHQATTSLENYFYLDTLAANQTANVTLRIKINGDGEGNSYQDTLAKVKMNFAVELTKSTSKKIHKSVDTSDTSNILMYSVIALVAGLACVGLVIYNVKSRKEED